MIERIEARDELLALVIRAGTEPAATQFVTSPELPMQVGFIVYSSGGAAPPHSHRPVMRDIATTPEALLVRRGRCLVDVYDHERCLVHTIDLKVGDLVLLLAGGHGVRMMEDTVLLEIKQGPYLGIDEKERFD